MPWDPYFRYYFHLWQTVLFLELLIFLKTQLQNFYYQAELHATMPHCAKGQDLLKKVYQCPGPIELIPLRHTYSTKYAIQGPFSYWKPPLATSSLHSRITYVLREAS